MKASCYAVSARLLSYNYWELISVVSMLLRGLLKTKIIVNRLTMLKSIGTINCPKIFYPMNQPTIWLILKPIPFSILQPES